MKIIKSILISCMALISAFSFSTSVYAQEVKKPDLRPIKAPTEAFKVPDLPTEDAADGLIDLFAILTG